MSLSTHVARMVLRNTTEPAVAVRMAQLLGAEVLDTNLRATSFPSEWVLAQQKQNTKLAAHAIKNCQDPDTLRAVVERPKSIASLREGVLGAIFSNPATPPDVIDHLVASATENRYGSKFHRWKKRHEELAVRHKDATCSPQEHYKRTQEMFGQLASHGATPTLTYVMRELCVIAERADAEPADVDKYLSDVLFPGGGGDRTKSALLSRLLLLQLTRGRIYRPEDTLLSLTTLDAKGLLESQSADDRAAAIADFFLQRRDPNESHLDLETVELLASYAPSDLVAKYVVRHHYSERILSEEAIDYVIENMSWRVALLQQNLTEQQFAALFSRLTMAEKSDALDFAITAERLDVVVADFEANPSHWAETIDATTARKLCRYLDGPNDERFVFIARATYTSEAAELFTVALPNAHGAWWPNARFLPEFASNPVLREFKNVQKVISNHESSSPEKNAYWKTYVDVVPGVAHLIVTTRAGSFTDSVDYIYQRISSGGADIELAAGVLDSQPQASLDQVCEVISRLAASN